MERKKDINYTNILNKIFYSIIGVMVLLAMIFIVLVVNGNGQTKSSSSTANTTEDETTGEYDVSMFETLTTTDAMDKIADNKKHFVYVGRSTCGYCVQFLPTLQKAQEEYGYETIYIDLDQMTSDDQTKLKTLDNDENYIEENLGYTPMVLIFEDEKLKDGWVGYAEYDEFASFLEDNGYKK